MFLIAYFMFLHYVLMDEAVQVCGVEYFIDLTGYTFGHQTFINANDMYTLAKHLSVSITYSMSSIVIVIVIVICGMFHLISSSQ